MYIYIYVCIYIYMYVCEMVAASSHLAPIFHPVPTSTASSSSLRGRLGQQAAGRKGVGRAVGLAHQDCRGLQQCVRQGGLARLGAEDREMYRKTRRNNGREGETMVDLAFLEILFRWAVVVVAR